jgi:hypothetical protein
MIRKEYISWPVLLCVMFFQAMNRLPAQVPYDGSFLDEAMACREHVILFTDRDMYTVNERIQFRCFYWIGGENAGSGVAATTGTDAGEAWSRVLYVEMVTPSGRAVAQGKYPNGPGGSSGYLEIPPDILTGRYYLRAYTRWMRNFDPAEYCYIPLVVVNPFTTDVLEYRNEASAAPALRFRMQAGGIECRTEKQVYSPGEEVLLEVSAEGPGKAETGKGLTGKGVTGKGVTGNYCLTVIPAGLADSRFNHILAGETGDGDQFRFDFLPDIRGVSISGTVVSTGDQSPLADTRVYFSLLGSRTDMQTVLTDENGRFILTMPDVTGTRELFVALLPGKGTGREVMIDQDFATDLLPFASAPFYLPEVKREAATRMARNMQFSMAYRQKTGVPVASIPVNGPGEDTITGYAQAVGPAVPFYGIPDLAVNTGEFVSLPTMTEIFENLVPDVSVHYRRGQAYLRMFSQNPNISLYPPLLLIDDVPVFDQASFLAVNPAKIRRIEVISDLYIKGDMIFGGLISIRSRQGDMAAIDLPEESYFFDYQAYYPGSTNGVDNLSGWGDEPMTGNRNGTQGNAGSRGRIPDTRNTLLWIDNIPLRPDEKKSQRFMASPAEGDYLILLRGVNAMGEPVGAQSTFRVER